MTKENAFDRAVMAHMCWLGQFRAAVDGVHRERLDPAVLFDDRNCEFGLWLHANPGLFSSPESFGRMCQVHADLHESASIVASLMNRVDYRELVPAAMAGLESHSRQLLSVMDAEAHLPARSLPDATPPA